MNCTSAQDMFSDLADDELAAVDVVRIEEHLATCRQCAQEWGYFKKSLAWLQEVQPVAPPADFLIGINAKLDREFPITTWLRDLFGSPLRTLSSLTVVGLALFFLIANDNANPPPLGHMADTGSFTHSQSATNQPTRLLSRQLKTIPAISHTSATWSNNVQANPYRLAPLPTFTPDIAITVHAPSAETRNLLYQRLVSQKHWRVHPVRNGTLLIYLNEREIPHLRHTLAPHRLTMTPKTSLRAQAGQLRSVSLNIETQ